MNKDTIKKSMLAIIPIALLVLAWFSGSRYGQWLVKHTYEAQVDTVVKIVTLYKNFPEPSKTAQVGFVSVPAYRFITDTLTFTEWSEVTVHDTTVVYLPREQKYYEEEEGKLKLWVSGYEPRVDRYEINWPETTITQTYVNKPRRWSLGLSVGYGMAVHDKTVLLSPFIGAGITYSLIQF